MSDAGISEEGVSETAAAYRMITSEVGLRVKTMNADLAEDLASRIEAAGRRERRQAKRLIRTLRVVHQGQESSVALGEKAVFQGQNAFNVLFGSEFGSLSGHGFKKWRKDTGYWVQPALDKQEPTLDEAYAETMDEMLEDWTEF